MNFLNFFPVTFGDIKTFLELNDNNNNNNDEENICVLINQYIMKIYIIKKPIIIEK